MERIEFGISLLGVLLIALTLAACGGGDDQGGATPGGADVTTVTTHFENGQVETSGTLDSKGRRQGEWQVFDASGQQLFKGRFVDDVLDHSQPWAEWNADGSVRYHHSDGPHPNGGPW